MALTEIPVELSSTPGIADSSNATAITIDSSENTTFSVDSNVILQGTHDEGGGLLFIKGTDTAAADKNLGSLCFGNPSDSCLAMIRGVSTDTTAADLRFYTEAQGGAIEERMRIQNSGITRFYTGDGNSGIAEFHTNASSGNTTSYISIRPQGTAKGYVGNGSSLLTGANVDDFIFRSENNAVINSGGNSESIRADNNGAVTLNKQPSFMARGLGQSNLANGTQLHFPSANEIIDRGSDYDGSTSVFTAPVTGLYDLSVNVRLISVTADANYIIVRLITSNRSYDWIWDPRPGDSTWDYVTATINVLADMDASDTAYVYYYQSGGTFLNDTGSDVGHFSGYLVA